MANKYETMMVITPQFDEEQTKALIEKFTSLISANGTVDKVDEWGKRRLAYEIMDQTDGYYVLVDFTSEPDFVNELTRVYNITDGILRSVVIKKEQ